MDTDLQVCCCAVCLAEADPEDVANGVGFIDLGFGRAIEALVSLTLIQKVVFGLQCRKCRCCKRSRALGFVSCCCVGRLQTSAPL